MNVTEQVIREFAELQRSYMEAHNRIVTLQNAFLEGMKMMGTGCVNEKSKADFIASKAKIHESLTRMKEICDNLTR
jgi:hypothetical protein